MRFFPLFLSGSSSSSPPCYSTIFSKQDGKTTQISSNQIDAKLRDDLERLKKIRNHRGLRHYWGLRVRGQHTKTTGRRGKTVGVSKKKG